MRMRFDLSSLSGCNVKSFVLRETDGKDEENALQRALARGMVHVVPEELLRLSIVEVDGKPAMQPFLGLDKWNSRTRAFATNAFDSFNGAKKAETDVFLLAATAIPDEQSPATGSIVEV